MQSEEPASVRTTDHTTETSESWGLEVETGFHYHDDLCTQELWDGIPEVLYQKQKTKAYTNLQEDIERLDRTFIFPLDILPFVSPQPSNSLSTFPR